MITRVEEPLPKRIALANIETFAALNCVKNQNNFGLNDMVSSKTTAMGSGLFLATESKNNIP